MNSMDVLSHMEGYLLGADFICILGKGHSGEGLRVIRKGFVHFSALSMEYEHVRHFRTCMSW